MTKKIWQYVLTCMMLLLSLNAASQVTVEQNVDSVGILIGEQAHLRLTVTMPAGSTIQWRVEGTPDGGYGRGGREGRRR